MKFATVINCMDGRVQIPVNEYLRTKLNVDYIDTITEAGPILILSENKDKGIIENIFKRISVSTELHKSKNIFIVGHYDCTGNPKDKQAQLNQLKKSISLISKNINEELSISGLWVDENFIVSEV